MRVGEKLAELLADSGVDSVFGVPGGQTLPLYLGISKLQGKIEHVLMRDERSAGFAADAYARLTGKVGVCDGTVGPGATNLVSPLAEAYCSSIPMIAIVSDISRAWEHRRTRGNASQAMDQMAMFTGVSKWQVRVTEPRSLPDIIDTALRVATTGKPGPVVVCVPEDVAYGDFDYGDRIAAAGGADYPRARSAPDPAEVRRAAQLLAKSAKPVLVVGGGAHISGCYDEVRELLEATGAALITTISGKGIIEETHPQVFGVTGTFGNPVARDVMKEADLVFFIGSKAGQLTTFSYRCPDKGIPVIHLDTDPEEIGRNFPESVPLVGDARLGVTAMLEALGASKPNTAWDFAGFKERYREWHTSETAKPQEEGTPLRPQAVMGAINEALTADDLIVCDASLSSGWAAAYLEFAAAGRTYIAPRGLAGLGWGSPAAIGSALATNRRKRVLQFAGDGGFGYSVQELEVMARFNLPVLSIVLNNSTLGWIKHAQRRMFEENYVSTDFNPVDFATIARGFGARGYSVRTLEELLGALEQERSPDGPAVIEVIADQWETPVLRFG